MPFAFLLVLKVAFWMVFCGLCWWSALGGLPSVWGGGVGRDGGKGERKERPGSKERGREGEGRKRRQEGKRGDATRWVWKETDTEQEYGLAKKNKYLYALLLVNPPYQILCPP